MSNFTHNLGKLKKYFGLSTTNRTISKAELLSSNEALKDFGKLWGDHADDVMMMAAIIEYEYTNARTYTPEEVGAVKLSLVAMIKFLKECSSEWKEYEYKQAKRQ